MGGPVNNTLCSQCKGPQFNPCSGNQILHATTLKKNFHMVQHSLKMLHVARKTWFRQIYIYINIQIQWVSVRFSSQHHLVSYSRSPTGVGETTFLFNYIPLAYLVRLGVCTGQTQLIGVLPQEIFKLGIALVAETLAAFIGFVCWVLCTLDVHSRLAVSDSF